ncbi:MAG: glycosyltransferase family 4 protein [Pleurocapsa sp.]
MHKPVLTIFYQFNPLNPSIGGIQTCIKYIIKYLPSEFELRLVGTGNDPNISTGQWHEAELYGRKFLFMPALYLENDNIRGLIPTTVKYTMAIMGKNFSSDFMQFYRLEPTLVTPHWSGSRIFHIQNDIEQAMKGASREGGILWRRFPWAYFALERLLVNQFSHILCCNSKSAQQYRQRYPKIADCVSYLPNAFDSDNFYPLTDQERQAKRVSLARELGLAEENRFILFAGRLHPQKQPVLLIRSIAALKQLNIHLLIVGQGELEDKVRSEITRLNLSKQVTLLGPLPQSKLAALYQISSIFILTSAYEGLALSSLEALACGTPVVTTRAGETPNFLTEESGIVCEEQSPTAIAAALEQVLEHPENYPTEACTRVAKPYNARDIVRGIYSNLLQEWQQKNAS